MDIIFNNLSKQWDIIKKKAIPRLERLFKNSDFIGGKAIEEFESNFAHYCETKYAVGVSNGTDALKLSLASLQTESPCGVIVPANTFIATVLPVSYLINAIYDLILIDCDEYYQIDTNLLEICLKKNRKKWNSCVILPVHLYGHPSNMKRILELAKEFDCLILEDSSQAHGAMVLNKKVGGFGNISAFSLYPGKNLGAAGDAGVITTNNEELYHKIKSLRNYGSHVKYHYDFIGWNNRMDTIQAIVVDEKLEYLDEWNNLRIKIARKYDEILKDNKEVVLPKTAPYITKQIYHIYAIRVKGRDKFQSYLTNNGIPTVIHYPIPIEKTNPFKHLEHFDSKRTLEYSNDLISLPMHPFLKDEEIEYITSKINSFFK